jgi:prepilin-type N-terminal cleavage/methylation domain-containing protein
LQSARSPARRRRSAFTLIEVLVALTLLSIVLVSLAKASTIVAVRGRDNGLAAQRTASLTLEANKMGAVPFTSLSNYLSVHPGSTFTVGGFSYTRRMTITSQSSTRYTIKIVVVPSTDTTKKDSVSFDRTNPGTTSPLCKTGC